MHYHDLAWQAYQTAIYNRIDHRKFPKWQTEARRYIKPRIQTEKEMKALVDAWIGGS